MNRNEFHTQVQNICQKTHGAGTSTVFTLELLFFSFFWTYLLKSTSKRITNPFTPSSCRPTHLLELFPTWRPSRGVLYPLEVFLRGGLDNEDGWRDSGCNPRLSQPFDQTKTKKVITGHGGGWGGRSGGHNRTFLALLSQNGG